MGSGKERLCGHRRNYKPIMQENNCCVRNFCSEAFQEGSDIACFNRFQVKDVAILRLISVPLCGMVASDCFSIDIMRAARDGDRLPFKETHSAPINKESCNSCTTFFGMRFVRFVGAVKLDE